MLKELPAVTRPLQRQEPFLFKVQVALMLEALQHSLMQSCFAVEAVNCSASLWIHKMEVVISECFLNGWYKFQPQLVLGLLAPTILLLVMALAQCPLGMGIWFRLCLGWLHNTNVVLFLVFHCTIKFLATTSRWTPRNHLSWSWGSHLEIKE